MSGQEEIPLWDSVAQPFASVLDIAFGCHHRRLSRVFTIGGHSYKVCCDCGAIFAILSNPCRSLVDGGYFQF